MFHKDGNRRRSWGERAFSLFLTAVMLLGSVPGLVLPASAAHWSAPYLDQLVDWGVMRADQTGNPDTPLTRAEFMAIINRAYGYKEVGPMPFEDVSKSDWFYDDVAIAYNAGYMKGTSKTTAAPNSRLTREQAICILGRNMMLKETPGEDLAFADSRSISGWARGMVKTAVNNYIVTGYPDDTFRPQANITKGQMAVLVTQCVGTPINASGSYELGDVSGNVTITSPNVTLRNTTVSGDLYVSGGVGLGGVKLENVNVLGRIVVSGTGESEHGAASVIMRNVNANELLVDNMRKKYVTVRADGITEIAKTTVRTNAYLEDNNTDDKGLLNITLEGKSGTQLDLAGRIKKVVDKTPNSFIQVAKGSVQSITVDEAAVNTVIQINRNTEVKELNLDVATNVNGEGDVGKLNINAPGSTVTMLPDEIYIRPGITGNVNGVVMDSAAAEESSLDPRLLSGYPAANDVAPTGFRADFAGNKKGTVYWAVSSIADGSIGAEDLISPPSYGSKAVRGGSVGVPAGDTVGSTQISGLTVGASYYLSAVLVDGRGERSPVKVISFTTPDNTVPAFAQGYPYMSLVSNTMAQVTVMPTKTCKLYYAVLLKGAPAPTASELRSASVTGNLGYGIVDVVKNTERVINVSNRLQELKEYTLYLWLTDADGVNSSAVVPVQFKTVDKTPPEFDPDPDPDAAVEENTSVKLTAGLNEPGTIYWVAVPKGRAYPPVNPANPDDNILDEETKLPVSSSLTSEYAKNQVKNHRGSVTAFGSVKVANKDTEVTINVDKLKEATAYDFYYVAQDSANNFSKEVKKITIKTKDTVGPVVTQYYRDTTRGEAVAVPRSSDEIVLKFNEDIKVGGSESLLDLYNNKKTSALKTALEANFKLFYVDDRGTPVPVDSDTKKNTWVDYSKAVVRKVDDGIEVALDPGKSAVKLVSGREYFFELAKITDLSDNPPKGMTAEATLRYDTVRNTEHVLPKFTIAPASVKLSEPSVNQISLQPDWVANPNEADAINKAGKENGGTREDGDTPISLARMDGRFYVDPESTSEMGDTYFYDIMLFSEKAMDYDVYYRVLDPKNEYKPIEAQDKFESYSLRTDDKAGNEGWAYLGNVKSRMKANNSRDVSGVNRDAERTGHSAGLDNLSRLKKLNQEVRYEFAISVTKLGGSSNFGTWGDKFKVYVSVIAGPRDRVDSVIKAGSATEETVATQPGITVISDPLSITMDFSKFDAPPGFSVGPAFQPYYDGTPTAQIKFGLNNPGILFYMIVPKDEPLSGTKITTREPVKKSETETIDAGTTITDAEADNANLWAVISAQTNSSSPGRLETDENGNLVLEYYSVQGPDSTDITGSGRWISYGRADGRMETVTLEYRDDELMEENKEYFIYIVLGSDASDKTSKVYIYNFMTGEIDKPKMTLDQVGETFKVDTEYEGTGVDSLLNWRMFQQSEAESKFGNKAFTPKDNKKAYPGVTTWLDALTTKFVANDYADTTIDDSKTGFTVFDVLASDTDKRAIWNCIREGASPSGGALKTYGNGSNSQTDRNYKWSINWYREAQRTRPDEAEYIKNMDFLILVGGRHEASDDAVGYSSFRALPRVSLRSLSAPQLNSATKRTLKMTWDDTDRVIKFEGAITLTFEPNKPVYWKNSQESAIYYKVMAGAGKPRGTGEDAKVGLAYNEGDRDDFPYTGATGSSPVFTVDFKDAERNSNYPLLPGWGLCAYYGNDPGTDLALSFTVEEESRPYGSGTAIYYRGKCEAVYSHRANNGSFVSYTDWISEYDLKGTTPPTPTPTPPTVTTANITSVNSLSSGVGEAKVDLIFDQDVYAKSGSRLSRVTTGKKLTVSVPITGKEKVQEIPVEIQDGNLYESTGQAYTDEPIKIKVTIETGNMGITRPTVEVYFGNKLVQKKQLA